jgi:hypothetical protein
MPAIHHNPLSLRVADIQEFYELTLLDDTKSIQQKTAETIRIANKWEATDGFGQPPYEVSFAIIALRALH